MRFRCCYVATLYCCNPVQDDVRDLWSGSAVAGQLGYTHGASHGFLKASQSSLLKMDMFLQLTSYGSFKYSAEVFEPEPPLHFKVVKIGGSLNASADTWEILVQSIVNSYQNALFLASHIRQKRSAGPSEIELLVECSASRELWYVNLSLQGHGRVCHNHICHYRIS